MAQDLSFALDHATHWPVRFAKGRQIYGEGDPSDSLYRVIDGYVRLQVNGENGSRQIVSFRIPGDIFGLCPRFRKTSAEAATAVQLMRYSLKSVMENGQLSSAIAMELMGDATTAYQELAYHIEKLVHAPALTRVKWFYQWMHDRNVENGNEAADSVPMSQRDIADYLGTTPETLSRCLAQLKIKPRLSRSRIRLVSKARSSVKTESASDW